MRTTLLRTETIQPMLSRVEIQLILNISATAANRLVNALPHVDVAAPGTKYKYLRVRREVFDNWLKERENK